MPAPCIVTTVNIVNNNVIKLNSYERYANAEPSIVGIKLADSDHGRTANKYVLIFMKTADGCSWRVLAIVDDAGEDDFDDADAVVVVDVDVFDEISPLFMGSLADTAAPFNNKGDRRPSPIC